MDGERETDRSRESYRESERDGTEMERVRQRENDRNTDGYKTEEIQTKREKQKQGDRER